MRASTSLCTPSVVRGTHTFKIAGYSLQRGLGIGRYLSSAAFDVGGYFWCIEYYPDGEMEMENGDYASIALDFASTNSEVRAYFEVRLADQANKLPPLVLLSKNMPIVFRSHPPTYVGKDFLQPSVYLRDDNLAIECSITVLAESKVAVTTTSIDIQVPPSDLSNNLVELLKAGEETDVTFKVRGESFRAHKIVLAMRSPVFKAVLFGPMGDRTRRTMNIEGIQPAIFSALLHFIYTDSLPSMGHLYGDDGEEMVKHLVMAADRYAMERMKVICESILCKNLNVQNVTTTLALADRYHCNQLKNACLEFITSPDRIDNVVASEGYAKLKRSRPAIIVDIFERETKSRKI
ncbi:BTB/POZ and MATH domain-containing protein 1-like [Triticum aestivum]|nr:BTB/POZ and MATH domain-containing protein 1-like [Triticum aestivum]